MLKIYLELNKELEKYKSSLENIKSKNELNNVINSIQELIQKRIDYNKRCGRPRKNKQSKKDRKMELILYIVGKKSALKKWNEVLTYEKNEDKKKKKLKKR